MPTTHVLYTAFFGVAIAALVVKLGIQRRHIRTSKLPRLPPPSSWIVGNMSTFIRTESLGDIDSELVNKYGLAFWLKGALNTDVLYLADPKGIQHVLNTCGYTFHKKPFLLRLIAGPSLIAVEGETHSRQRKIMNPGFSHGALKEFVPTFTKIAQKAVGKWRDIVVEEGNSAPVIDIYAWLSRITLDAVGQAAFSYDFGTVDNADTEFVKAYRNVFVKAFHKPSDVELLIITILQSLPTWTIPFLRSIPARGVKALAGLTKAAHKVAESILQRETQALDAGLPPGRDIMSILVRANRSESPKSRLSDEELRSQMMTVLVAGHDTTTATLVWIFYELARNPAAQHRLREEIKATRATVTAAGRAEIGLADFESMDYTVAVIKETLRFYPIAAHNLRVAGRDEVIPLSKPYRTAAGEEITTVPVRRGQNVLMSFWSYNRIKSLWGEDAEDWKPERFMKNGLPDSPKTSVGVYANLATFSSGVHSCIGWRLAVFELQAVLIELIENFSFSLPPTELDITIYRGAAPTLIPLVKGQDEQGAQMPLVITPIH